MKTDDYILPAGRVAGVRSWRLANTLWAKLGGWLWSHAMTDCWRKNVEWKAAECPGGHPIPGEGCSCGIWAFHNPHIIDEQYGPLLPPRTVEEEPFQHVRGVIIADGNIIPATLGFRAQYAKVAAIFEDGYDALALATKEEIAGHYHCDIIAPEDYDTFCAKHGIRRLDLE
jgi:hypothetical protein